MTGDLYGPARMRAKDWVVSAALHIALVGSAGWALSHSVLDVPAHTPLDLSVGWQTQAAPETAAPEPPAPPKPTPAAPPKVMPRSTPTPPLPAPSSAPVAQPAQAAAPDVVVPAAATSSAPVAPAPAQHDPRPSAEPADAPSPVSTTTEQPRWQGQLESMLAKYKHYPRVGQRMRQEGVVTVEAHFSATGEIVRCVVVGTSGFKALDEAALQLVQQAADIARARHQPGRATELRIPIVYELKES